MYITLLWHRVRLANEETHRGIESSSHLRLSRPLNLRLSPSPKLYAARPLLDTPGTAIFMIRGLYHLHRPAHPLYCQPDLSLSQFCKRDEDLLQHLKDDEKK